MKKTVEKIVEVFRSEGELLSKYSDNLNSVVYFNERFKELEVEFVFNTEKTLVRFEGELIFSTDCFEVYDTLMTIIEDKIEIVRSEKVERFFNLKVS